VGPVGATPFSSLVDFSALKMEAIVSCETSVLTGCTRPHMPEPDILPIGGVAGDRRQRQSSSI
jgi:hypothetical protein